MGKYTAYVEVGFQVEFSDNEEDGLVEQAFEAVNELSISDYEEMAVCNIHEIDEPQPPCIEKGMNDE